MGGAHRKSARALQERLGAGPQPGQRWPQQQAVHALRALWVWQGITMDGYSSVNA